MLLNKMESIEVSETTFGRMLGYGTIVVIGTGGTPEPFHKVAHPLEFRNQVQQQIEKLPSPHRPPPRSRPQSAFRPCLPPENSLPAIVSAVGAPKVSPAR